MAAHSLLVSLPQGGVMTAVVNEAVATVEAAQP
jgi:hypothetical protein